MNQTDWQPIETAPRDGTPILVFDPTRPDHRELDGKIYDNPRYAISYYRTWYPPNSQWMWGNRNSSECSPTHWMPLPPIPTIPVL